jgi:hypothetical protein
MATVAMNKGYPSYAFRYFLPKRIGNLAVYFSTGGNASVYRGFALNDGLRELHATGKTTSTAVCAWQNAIDLLDKRITRYRQFSCGKSKSKPEDKPHRTQYDCRIAN